MLSSSLLHLAARSTRRQSWLSSPSSPLSCWSSSVLSTMMNPTTTVGNSTAAAGNAPTTLMVRSFATTKDDSNNNNHNSNKNKKKPLSSSSGGRGNNTNNKKHPPKGMTTKNPSSSSSSSSSSRRTPNKTYMARHLQPLLHKPMKRSVSQPKGPKEPNDITRRVPTIDLNKIEITNVDAEPEDDEWLDPLIALALQQAQQRGKYGSGTGGGATTTAPAMLKDLDVETQLKMMDYFVSQPGSTEDRVGERRILALEMDREAATPEDRQRFLDEIDQMIEYERINYLELPETVVPTMQQLEASETGGIGKIPSNQLAHGDWGELLIRTDRVCKMWRGGRIESYRALVIGGNLRGCGGFGVGKSFEPEDAVAIASRMARRNIFFVDRYRNKSLTRDLMGRQNSCRVYLRSTDNGLRGNPVACEILKLMGITNAVCKAHGNRNHYNVVRATFKALLTHESLDEIALKRGVRLINLQKAKRLQI